MRIKRPLVCKHSARAGTDLEKHGHEKQGQTLKILGDIVGTNLENMDRKNRDRP